jgi:hypothetical protein
MRLSFGKAFVVFGGGFEGFSPPTRGRKRPQDAAGRGDHDMWYSPITLEAMTLRQFSRLYKFRFFGIIRGPDRF